MIDQLSPISDRTAYRQVEAARRIGVDVRTQSLPSARSSPASAGASAFSAWRTLLAIDFNEPACTAHALNFLDTPVICGTVADNLNAIPECGIIHGGPPCQSFSLVGEGLGEDDDRDGIPDFIAAVELRKPRHFLMENVRGLITQKHWPYFVRSVRRFEAAGYVVDWKLLYAVNFGVPQFRERVWVWGIRRDLYRDGMRHAWPTPTHQWPPPETCMFGAALLPGVTLGQAIFDIQPVTDYQGAPSKGRNAPRSGERRTQRDITDEPSTTLSVAAGNALPQMVAYGGSEPWRLNRPSMAVVATEGKGAQNAPYFNPAKSPARASDSLYRATGVRCLTPLECARLQSMPDDYIWPEKITKTNQYRIVGNGQASEMTRHLGNAIRAVDPECLTAVSLFCGGGLGDCGFEWRSWRYEPGMETAGVA